MYSAQRNHFKPLPENSKPADLLPPTTLSSPSMDAAPPLPDPGAGMAREMAAPDMGAPAMDAAPMMDAAPIPGL